MSATRSKGPGLVGRLGWWGGIALGWPILLAAGLVVMAVLVAVFDVVLQRMGAAPGVAAAAATSCAAIVAIVVLVAASWRIGGVLAKRGMPARLWLVPAGYAGGIGAVLLVSMVALFFMGVPGPLPWSVETITGFTVFLASAIAPAAAAAGFRMGSRRVRSWTAAQAGSSAPAAQEGV